MFKTITVAAGAALLSSAAIAETEYAEIVEAFAEAMEENYVFPEVGEECAKLLRRNLESGFYDEFSAEELAQQVHTQLMAITEDGHFGVSYTLPQPMMIQGPQGGGGGGGNAPANHGFRKVETMAGNVGYLDFGFFDGSEGAQRTTDAAMAFLRDSDALIVDMRQNGGGDPHAVRYICSYLFGEEPVHLNSLYDRRTNETQEFWTLTDLPGERLDDIPVYVLTSSYTFSGAEEFSYNLQTQKRGTLVGETTGGGAHPVMGLNVGGGFTIRVPFARAINPVTGTNWEGTGVNPDIDCPADQALDIAHMMALDELTQTASGDRATRLAWAADFLRSKVTPVSVDEAKLRKYAGSYGPRQVTFKDGRLFYTRGGPERPLNAISQDTFMIEGVDFFKLKFVADNKGVIKSVLGSYAQGHSDVSMRD